MLLQKLINNALKTKRASRIQKSIVSLVIFVMAALLLASCQWIDPVSTENEEAASDSQIFRGVIESATAINQNAILLPEKFNLTSSRFRPEHLLHEARDYTGCKNYSFPPQNQNYPDGSWSLSRNWYKKFAEADFEPFQVKISGGTKPYGIAFVEIRGWLEESGGETTLHVESGRIDHCHTMLLSDGCAIPKTNNACLALFDAEGQLETSWEFEGGRAKRVAAGPNGAGDEVQVRFDYVKSSARANDSTGRVAPGSAQKLGVSLIPASDGTPLFDQDGYFRPEYGPNPPRVQIRAADLSRLMGIEEAELEGAQGAAPDQRIFIQDDTYIRTLRRGPDQLKIFAPLKLKDARTLWFWGDATYRD